MRFALYSYNYAPEPTGIAVYNTALCTWLARHGWSVSVHTGVPFYPHWRVPEDYRAGGDELLDGVRVERVRQYVPPEPSARGRILLDASWLLLTALRSLRARSRPQVIMVIAPPFLSGVLAAWLRWRWRCPIIYHVQDLQVDAALDLGLLPRRLARLLLASERWVLARMDLVSTISTAMRRRLAAKGPTRRPIALLPNWVTPERLVLPEGANRYRAEWGLPESAILVAYSGSIGRKQGLESLLEACALLRDHPHLHWLIAGAGPVLDALKEQAARLNLPRLRFVPLAPSERLAEFLGAADLHCILQRAEAADLVLPSKLLNVMCVGRPVVATALPGTELSALIGLAQCGIEIRNFF